ncbi:MAG TPA: hypothetical protein VF221_23310 [Chloroflexota bacterium]
MPVQKGKRRKRPRNRVPRDAGDDIAEQAAPAATRASGSRPASRQRRQPPPWLNVTLGTVMVVAGSYFTIVAPGGLGTPGRLILLLGYFLIAGYYFGKAYRQYRRRGQTS